MFRPGPGELLAAWERSSRCGPHERALHLLAWAEPEIGLEALGELDVGARDWKLLMLRRTLFGATLAAVVDCPHCGERLELELDADAMLGDCAPAVPPLFATADGLRFRLPNGRDLMALAAVADPDLAIRALLARCKVAGPDDGERRDLEFIDALVAEVDDGLEAIAGPRSLQLALDCDACGGQWRVDFDAGAFLWEEIESKAMRLLDEVHLLASAYGWDEAQVLALGDFRRAAYLSRID